MSCTIEESRYPGVWSVTYRNAVELKDRLLAIAAVRSVLMDRTVKGVLIDFRGVRLEMSKEQSYDLVRERLASGDFLGVRRAFLYDSLTEEVEFDAVVSQNRAQMIRAFTDEDEAFSWLTGSF